jgi:negative regulator of flagellin synthesis FlgM
MKITNLNSSKVQQSSSERPARSKAAGTGTAPTDSIRISDLSSRLAALETKLGADPAFDSGKVDAIKAAMRDGQFKVNTGVVADRVIESARELLSGKK